MTKRILLSKYIVSLMVFLFLFSWAIFGFIYENSKDTMLRESKMIINTAIVLVEDNSNTNFKETLEKISQRIDNKNDIYIEYLGEEDAQKVKYKFEQNLDEFYVKSDFYLKNDHAKASKIQVVTKFDDVKQKVYLSLFITIAFNVLLTTSFLIMLNQVNPSIFQRFKGWWKK